MALNFNQYVGGAKGGGGDGQSIAARIAASMPTNEEKALKASQDFWDKKDKSAAIPISYENGALNYDSAMGAFKAQTLTEAWNEYSNHLRQSGARVRPDEYSNFAQTYANKSGQYAQNIGIKFMQMKNSGIGVRQIRAMVDNNPELKMQLIKLGAINPELHAQLETYLSGGKGIIPGVLGKGTDLAIQGSPLLIKGALKGYSGMKDMTDAKGFAEGFKKGARPFSEYKGIAKNALLKDKTLQRAGSGLGFGKKEAKIKLNRAEKVLQNAKDKFKISADKYKKLKPKGRFLTTKEAKRQQRVIKGVQKGVNTLYGTGPKGAGRKASLDYIKNYVSKNGVSGMVKKLAQKGGTSFALKTMGRLGLSAGMKAGGVATGGLSAAASLSLDAYTVYSIAKMLQSTIAEESGGFRAPGEMLFGGDSKPSKNQKMIF